MDIMDILVIVLFSVIGIAVFLFAQSLSGRLGNAVGILNRIEARLGRIQRKLESEDKLPSKLPRMIPLRLTKEANVEATTNKSGEWSAIFSHQVPTGAGYIFQTGNTLSIYLQDALGNPINDSDEVRVKVKSILQDEWRVIYGPAPYCNSKELCDSCKMPKFYLPVPVRLHERQWVTIEVKTESTIDVDKSYFELNASKIELPKEN